LSTRCSCNLQHESGASLSGSPFPGKILLIAFVLGLVFYPMLAPLTSESDVTSSGTFNSVFLPDFTIGTTVPVIVPADATTLATSTIVVNPIDHFNGTVVLSDLPLPADLKCTAMNPTKITNGSGNTTLSCSSTVAGTHAVTITGTSGAIRHDATAMFTFAAFTYPDFTIAPIAPVSMVSATTATSNVTVIPQGGFSSEVTLTANAYPSTGLSVFLLPQRLVLGSGTATASFSATVPGDYNVTITAMSKSLSHKVTIVVRVTLTGQPDFEISARSPFNIEAGNPSTTRIIVTPSNGFTDVVTLFVEAPAGISCSLSPINILTSGTSTLTCNSVKAGEYTITIRATGGTSQHIAVVKVSVASVSPAPPIPPTTLGLAPAVFYAIIAGTIAIVVAGTVLVRRPRGSLA